SIAGIRSASARRAPMIQTMTIRVSVATTTMRSVLRRLARGVGVLVVKVVKIVSLYSSIHAGQQIPGTLHSGPVPGPRVHVDGLGAAAHRRFDRALLVVS